MSIWIDRETAIRKLKAAAARLKSACPEVREVRLIGSLARGDHTGTSDADVLLVLQEGGHNPVERMRKYLPFFDLDLAVDVIPLTVNELADLSAHQTEGGMSLLEGSIPLA